MNELKEKELIETNAVLQESLTKENEKYYGNLLIYIRIMAFFRDVKKSEELLLEVLRDILMLKNKVFPQKNILEKIQKKSLTTLLNSCLLIF